MNPDLYSPDIESRYQASVDLDGHPTGGEWPFACSGAANAFLALVGPSMGGAGADEKVAHGGADRPEGGSMTVGRDVMNFDWGDGRKALWTRMCSEMLGDEKYVTTLTALLNLDWRHASSEKGIPTEGLLDGLNLHVWPALTNLRPRLVCPLTNRVWETVLPTIEALSVPFAKCPIPLRKEPVVFRFPGCEFSTMLVKPHNHPSRPFSNEQKKVLGQACQWFLRES